MMKRFANDKLHEFVEKEFYYNGNDYCIGRYSGQEASENDIAGYLQDALKIAVSYSGLSSGRWEAYYLQIADRVSRIHKVGNKSRTKAILEQLKQIKEAG